ncbi:MAG: GNAT family N-acetyltransferase [Bacteroidales bacterium]|nr:GNAT family N-acetyltransferase [Bacteroidales bacterium]
MNLRPFASTDAPVILGWSKDKHSFRLWSATRFREFPASPKELEEQFEDGKKYPMVATVNDEIVGFMLIRYPSEDKTVVRFGFVIVDEMKRGLGYGKQMLRLAIEYVLKELGAKRITLGVYLDNIPALECYRSLGFRIVDEVTHIVDGEAWKSEEMELFIGQNLEVLQIKELIAQLADTLPVTFISSVDEEGFPWTKAMLSPRVREAVKVFYFTTNTSSMRVAQYRKNPKASIYFCDTDGFKGMMLRGTMEVLTDAKSKEMIWRDGDTEYYAGGVTDPDYCVLKFTAKDGRFYSDFNPMSFVIE